MMSKLGGGIMARPAKGDEEDVKVVTRNKRAFHDYEILERMECGIVLVGTEVKSLRDGHANLEDAYAKFDGGEVWLVGSEIPEYAMGNRLNHKPKRSRKLLLHRREIERLIGATSEKGLTIVPTRLYWSGPRAKVELAVAKGKDLYDKRRSIKERDTKREIQRAMSERY
jgi:SsrA-binding protein